MYVQRLPPSARAVLFDRTKCWLIKTFNYRAESHSSVASGINYINSIEEILWVDSGSERVFLDFIVEALNPWMHLLWSACNVFSVNLVDNDAFLGAGATGRVFKVLRADNSMVALKIIRRDLSLLMVESTKMKAAENTGVVATVLEDYKLLDNGNGAGMLISPVGVPMSREMLTEDIVMTIVRHLFILHSAGIQHGDPRVPNLIWSQQRFLWIDLMYSTFGSELGWEKDAQILSRSILGLSEKSHLSPQISALISQYSVQKNDESCQALARQLWAEFSTRVSL